MGALVSQIDIQFTAAISEHHPRATELDVQGAAIGNVRQVLAQVIAVGRLVLEQIDFDAVLGCWGWPGSGPDRFATRSGRQIPSMPVKESRHGR